jgi:PAS domain S-box-containing protein
MVQAVLRNITQRKQAEAENARLIRCIEQVGESIVITDLDASILYVNPAFEKLTGYSRGEALGQNPRVLKSGRHSASFYQQMWDTLMGGETWSGELINRRKDGTLFQEEATISPIKNKDGRTTNFVAVKRDITLRKLAEAELEQAREKAEAANRAKSEFLANMSHEIRTPMNGVIGMTELALETDLTEEQREFLGLVKSSADSLLSLINDILDFSRIEAGRLDIETIDFCLRDMLDDTVKALGLRAQQKGLELTCHVLPDVPEGLTGDPNRLRQVFVNLVGNAIKFTPQGEVVVLAEIQEKIGDEVVLHFSVKDTGVGIPLDKQQNIFDAFTQADNSMTRKFGGTGLGLSISTRLVNLMGGRIWVESEIGRGSTFHFTVRFRMQEPCLQPCATAGTEKLRDLPVLIVDDNATNRRMLQEIVMGWQMKPTLAQSGQEALMLLERAATRGTPFALVLLDVVMPGLDGFEVAERMHQDALFSQSAVIPLASASVRGDATRSRKLGVGAFLTKPIRRSDLLHAIKSVLQPPVVGREKPSVATVQPLGINAGRLRILLVEDDRVNQTVAIRLLEKRGHEVSLAENGAAALAAIEKQVPDCVLMDIHMPEMDGFRATAAIRAREVENGRHIPIVAMTANAMAGDKQKCLAAGMDGYISKPLRAHDLFSVIEQVVPSTD